MLILNRSRRRAPNLRIQDRFIAGLCSHWIEPSRLRKVALAFKTSTLRSFHRALVQRKYRLLFSPKQRTKPGPKGPAGDLIHAVVEMKKRKSQWGCPKIADQINLQPPRPAHRSVLLSWLPRIKNIGSPNKALRLAWERGRSPIGAPRQLGANKSIKEQNTSI
jgi:hypothetical protein